MLKTVNKVVVYVLHRKFILRILLFGTLTMMVVFNFFGVKPPVGRNMLKILTDALNAE